ncbi:MAG: alanine--tRNA ligase [Chitinophagales bacterium]|nr:alanine--tRNA ligase [Chitinophagales bacterium]
MSVKKSTEIRRMFLDFFKNKSHTIVPSAPLVLKNDPTLMFTIAGMTQFKDIFLGYQPASSKRVADTQKCLRVSGKQNDLEEVGIDTYHHTMFEMLGNWSFGDYFKEEALAWSWELLTEVYKIDKSRIYVTVFGGDKEDGLESDEEAATIWAKYIDKERILRCSKKDNFWEMGNTGPCGPCSEIHVDIRSDEERASIDGKTLVNNDHPQVIEIWNNVFIQFNRKQDGSLEELPDKHVDTGMGFERLCMVLQGKTSNYDTDVFMPLINKVEQVSGIAYGTDTKKDIAMRVLVDHIRAISFSITDGQLPSNTGAGYVIRRILRRAVRYYYNFLDTNHPLLYLLVDTLAEQFKDVFPELDAQKDLVKKVIKEEESNFLKTLESGLRRFNALVQHLEGNIIKGSDAFELYDTYGFPYDLTDLLAREQNLQIDEEGFNIAKKEQQDRSRLAYQAETSDWHTVADDQKVTFVGYDEVETVSNIIKHRYVRQKNKDFFQVVLDKTPFYPEGGGQQGDIGVLLWGHEEIKVVDTKKENDLIVHFVEQIPGGFTGEVVARVDLENRKNSMKNHSATHLLQAALKQVLGNHIQQKGSFLNGDILRFDFSHFAKLTDEEIRSVENLVNAKILENIPLTEYRNMPKDDAMKMGAMALFGEKYGNNVRVIVFDESYSIELCGGTHVKGTGEIGLFKIISETAIAAGMRRIEAVTGKGALQFIQEKLQHLEGISQALNNTKEPLKVIIATLEENQKLKKDIEKFQMQEAESIKNKIKESATQINGIHFIGQILEQVTAEQVKKICFDLKQEFANAFIVIGAEIQGKPQISVIISDELVKSKGFHAGNIVKELAKLVKGGGGGQPFYATAGGNDVNGLKNIIEAAKSYLA